MANVIVTGAAGFIGSHLSRALIKAGHAVAGVDNFDPFYDRAAKLDNVNRLAAAHAGFELIEADIRDASATRETVARTRPATVFHMAALAGVRPSIADPSRYASVNVDGLVSVLEAARAGGERAKRAQFPRQERARRQRADLHEHRRVCKPPPI